jgi:NAD(P)-dependent dehydrogenase (short-subunit alcohol dehydrogenase family)
VEGLRSALFAIALDKRGQANGIRAFSVHAGGIYTDLIRYLPTSELAALSAGAGTLKTPEQGAATSVWCATSPQLDGKGGEPPMMSRMMSTPCPEVRARMTSRKSSSR